MEVCYHQFSSISSLWICLRKWKGISPNLQMMEHYGTLEQNIPELAEKVAADVKKIQYHCNTWRMKISLCKTEVTLFQAEETCDNSR